MVRARRVDDEWHLGRLGVAPDLRGLGVGSWLLRLAEEACEPGCRSLCLSTGARSWANIRRYESAGYQQVTDRGAPGVVRLAKPQAPGTSQHLGPVATPVA
jgi:ribosomal protein S18 acetylase RimI-like enzyme